MSDKNMLCLYEELQSISKEKDNAKRKKNPGDDAGVWYISESDQVWITFSGWVNTVAYTKFCGQEVATIIDGEFKSKCVWVGEL